MKIRELADFRVKQWTMKDFVTYISLLTAYQKGCIREIEEDECVDSLIGLRPAEFDMFGDGMGYHLGLTVYIPLSAIMQEIQKCAPELDMSENDVIVSMDRLYMTSWYEKKRKPYHVAIGRIFASFSTIEHEDGTTDKLYDLDARAFERANKAIRHELAKAKIAGIEVLTTKHGAVKAWRFTNDNKS